MIHISGTTKKRMDLPRTRGGIATGPTVTTAKVVTTLGTPGAGVGTKETILDTGAGSILLAGSVMSAGVVRGARLFPVHNALVPSLIIILEGMVVVCRVLVVFGCCRWHERARGLLPALLLHVLAQWFSWRSHIVCHGANVTFVNQEHALANGLVKGRQFGQVPKRVWFLF